jgi:hypothetical protein
MNRIDSRITRTVALFATLAALAVQPARAADQGGGMPGEWLSQYAGARALGMGGANVAMADDALGILWNPGGLSQLDQNQLMFENLHLFEDTSLNGFSIAVPGSWLPSFGLSMVSMSSGDFQRTNDVNDALGSFKEGETAYLFTMARGFSPRFSVGTNVKLVQQTIEDFSGGGFGVDLGAMYQLTPQFKVGFSALNLGGPSITLRQTAETYPTEYRGGVTLNALNGRAFITTEIDQSTGLGTRFHGGAEYWIQPGLAARVGYDDTRATGGFSYRFLPQYQFDYGVADHPLGMTHRFGLTYRFGGFFAASHADPEVFSPTGEKAVTKIDLNAHTKSGAESWTLELHDKSNAVVRKFGGPGQPPAHLLWDGKDESGMPMADGTYRYQLTVKDKEGRILVGPMRQVEIFTNGPQGAVPVLPVQ